MEGGVTMKNEEKKGGLILSPEAIVILKSLKGEDKICFIDCVLDYHENGTLPNEDVSEIVTLSFNVFRMAYDNDQQKYKDKCERNRENIRKRYEKVRTNSDVNDGIRTNTKSTNNNNNNNNNVTNVTEEDKEEAGQPLQSSPAPHSERYAKFIVWFGENCPHLKKMEQPTEEQFFKLLDKSGSANQLQDILLAMENDKNTPSKRRSVYLTANNWLNRDLKK